MRMGANKEGGQRFRPQDILQGNKPHNYIYVFLKSNVKKNGLIQLIDERGVWSDNESSGPDN